MGFVKWHPNKWFRLQLSRARKNRNDPLELIRRLCSRLGTQATSTGAVPLAAGVVAAPGCRSMCEACVYTDRQTASLLLQSGEHNLIVFAEQNVPPQVQGPGARSSFGPSSPTQRPGSQRRNRHGAAGWPSADPRSGFLADLSPAPRERPPRGSEDASGPQQVRPSALCVRPSALCVRRLPARPRLPAPASPGLRGTSCTRASCRGPCFLTARTPAPHPAVRAERHP